MIMLYIIIGVVVLLAIIVIVLFIPSGEKKNPQKEGYKFELLADGGDGSRLQIRLIIF